MPWGIEVGMGSVPRVRHIVKQKAGGGARGNREIKGDFCDPCDRKQEPPHWGKR